MGCGLYGVATRAFSMSNSDRPAMAATVFMSLRVAGDGMSVDASAVYGDVCVSVAVVHR